MNPDYKLKDNFLDGINEPVDKMLIQMKEILKDISTDEPDVALEEMQYAYDLYKFIKSTYNISSFARLMDVYFDTDSFDGRAGAKNEKVARELLVEALKKVNPATRLLLEMNDKPLVDEIESWM